MKKACKFIVRGTVQGIFYRQFVKEHADKIGVTGFVHNTENGDVEVVVEGLKDEIERFGRQLKEGPAHSQIREVNAIEQKWSGEFSEFKILRF